MTGQRALYVRNVRDHAADPASAVSHACPLCPHRILCACWMGRHRHDRAALRAFLDGIEQLQRRSADVTVWGFWLPETASKPPKPEDRGSQPCQLWRASDRTMITESSFHDAVATAGKHTCARLN